MKHPNAELIIAFLQGEYLQYRWKEEQGCWSDLKIFDNPNWEFRIKPKAVSGWLNVCSDIIHDTKEEADSRARFYRTACIQITYTPGEGL